MKYSFLLVNYNMAKLIRSVVKNIGRRVPVGSAYEVLIADNSSDSAHRLSPSSFVEHDKIKVIPLAENRGFVDALNQLLPMARGEYVVIMHPDVELNEGCLEALTAFLQDHPRAGVVSPDLNYPNGQPNRIRLRFPTVTTENRRCCNILTQMLLRRRFMRDEIFWDRQADAQSDMVMSVCMMFRGDTLRAIGPIDRRLVFYYANDFLCGRAGQLGWSCHYVKAARAIHFERYTPRTEYSAGEAMSYKESPIAANPRMRADYCVFLQSFYPLWSRLGLRGLALIEDLIEMAAQFRHPWQRRNNIVQLARSIAVHSPF
jgi:GT2 family glycosyltransferase